MIAFVAPGQFDAWAVATPLTYEYFQNSPHGAFYIAAPPPAGDVPTNDPNVGSRPSPP
jgi:hypothetical protein